MGWVHDKISIPEEEQVCQIERCRNRDNGKEHHQESE